PILRSQVHRASIRSFARKHYELYRDLRQDVRFAAPRLWYTLHMLEDYAYLSGYKRELLRRPLKRHAQEMYFNPDWKQSPYIDTAVAAYTSAHPSIKDPAKIACYPTRAYAAARRELVMTAGKFFQAVMPDLSATDVQKKAQAYAMH